MPSTCVGCSDPAVSVLLRTERLSIAPLGVVDLEAFVAYRRHPDVARFQGWTPDYSAADARALIEGQPSGPLPPPGEWLQVALHAHPDPAAGPVLVGDVAIGCDAVHPDTYELGVTIAPEHQGSGYAREALTAVVDALMGAHGAHRIVSCSAMPATSRFGASSGAWGCATRERPSRATGSRGSGQRSSVSPSCGGSGLRAADPRHARAVRRFTKGPPARRRVIPR